MSGRQPMIRADLLLALIWLQYINFLKYLLAQILFPINIVIIVISMYRASKWVADSLCFELFEKKWKKMVPLPQALTFRPTTARWNVGKGWQWPEPLMLHLHLTGTRDTSRINELIPRTRARGRGWPHKLRGDTERPPDHRCSIPWEPSGSLDSSQAGQLPTPTWLPRRAVAHPSWLLLMWLLV